MNREEWVRSNSKEKRIRVAECDGFSNIEDIDFSDNHCDCPYMIGIWEGGNKLVPDYLSDLNACHKFEIKMSDIEYEMYWNILVEICVSKGYNRMNSSTAEMKAEAFVLTMTGGE